MTKNVLVSYFSEPTTNLLLINCFIDVTFFLRNEFVRYYYFYILYSLMCIRMLFVCFLLFAL